MIAELQLNPQTKEFQLIPLPMSVDTNALHRKNELNAEEGFQIY